MIIPANIDEIADRVDAEHGAAEWERLAAGTPAACEYFINTYCWTMNPDMEPPETRMELYGYQEDFINDLFKALRERLFLHVDKSRQMGDSWTVQAFKFYCLLFVPGFTSLTLSRKANDIDDGGEKTVDSLFGRIKFMHDRLPKWLMDRAGVTFAWMRITAGCNPGAYLVGEGSHPEAARHGSYMFGDWDEMARTQFGRTIMAGWRRSVRSGIYLSTPNGKNNVFARLKKTIADKLVHISHHWRLHPVFGKDAYQGEDGRWRSEWYDRETQDMTDDEIASELDISYEGSVAGIIYREWDAGFVVSPDINYDRQLSICMDWDFGIGDDTAVIILQINGNEERILRAHAGSGLLPHQHFAHIESILYEIGYKGDYSEFRHYADPSGIARNIASGNSAVWEYEQLFKARAGGKHVQFNLPRYSVEDGIRTCRRRLKAGHIRVSERAPVFIDAIESYQRELDRDGNVKPDAKPKHDWSSHPMDAWRYGSTGRFGIRGETQDEPFTIDTQRPREWVVKK